MNTRYFLSAFLLLGNVVAQAQIGVIVGNTNVEQGNQVTYSFQNDFDVWSGEWEVINGTVLWTNSNPSIYYYEATVYWQSSGTGTVKFKDSGVLLDQVSITIRPQPPGPYASTSITTSSFLASWAPLTSVTSYQLDVSTSSTFNAFISGFNGLSLTSTSYSVTGLTPGTTYYYRVRGVNGGLVSNNSIVIPTLTLPAPPTALSATNASTSSFTANWASVVSATSYRLDVSTASNFSSFVSGYNNLVVNATSQTITGLSPGTTYYYRVRAVNATGSSTNSNAVSKLTLPAPPTTNSPTNLGTSSFTANWSIVASATSYRLDVSTVSNFASFVSGFNNASVGSTIQSVTGLAGGTTYYYRARAVNGSGTSSNSNTTTALTLPPAPTASAATTVATTSFTANWAPSLSATSYRLDVSTVSNFSSFVSGYNNLTLTATNKSVTGLTSGTTYYYRVRAVNGSGTSSNSNTSATITLPSAPAANNATGITATSFTASWSGVTGATSYRLDVSTVSNFASFVSGFNNASVASTSQNITGLAGGTTYYYRVRAINNFGASVNSNAVTTLTVPNPPTATSAASITPTSFVANWGSSASATGYKIDISHDINFTNLVPGYVDLYVNSTSKNVTGLSPGAYYYYRIRAINPSGSSVNSNTIIVLAGPPAPNAAPASTTGTTAFTANWASVPTATSYRLDVSNASDFSSFVAVYNNFTVNATSQIVSGLVAGNTYYYRVRAVSASGVSANSNTINLTTITNAPIATAASKITSQSFIANWNAVAGASSYLLDVSTNDTFSSFVSGYNALSLTGTSANVTSLVDKHKYYFRLRAVNASGISTYSNAIFVVDLDRNFVLTNDILISGVATPAQVDALTTIQKTSTYNFIDGLGRTAQTVQKQRSPLGLDIVQPVVYDEYGRDIVKYLPYADGSDGWFKPDFIAKESTDYNSSPQALFYQNAEKIAHTNVPYATSVLESSPLSRLLKQGAPGEAWQPNSNPSDYSDKVGKMEYSFNKHDEVLLWSYDPTTNRISAHTGSTPIYYPPATLYANTTYDEHNNRVIEYVDKQGRTVLKRVQAVGGSLSTTDLNKDTNYASTYYIYDDLENLACVLQPEGVKNLSLYHTASADNQESFLSNWAFRYKYDGRKRMIEKQVPGAQPVYLVYDNRDRLVLTQDGKLRSSRMWSFTKYDHLNRPILTGIKDTSVVLNQQEIQAVVDAHYNKPGSQYSESFVGNVAGNIHGYSNNTYPIDTRSAGGVHAYDYVTVTYYDDYDFIAHWSDEFQYVNDGLSALAHGDTYAQPASAFTRTKGLVTGTRIKVLDGGIRGGYVWLNNASYYDDRYRVIQTVSENYHGGVDRTSNLYDFTGKVLKTKTTHSTGLVTWKDLNGTAITANKLYKNISGSGWNTAGAASAEQLPAGQDGWIEVTVSEANHSRMIGLSDENPDDHYNTIDFTFYLNGSTLRIYESGSLKHTVPGGILPADRLRIARTSNIMTYYRNSELVYTSLTPSSSLLMVDASLSNSNSSLLNVRASFSTKKDSITRRFDYDHAGRLTRTWHQLNNDPEILLAHNKYNELGQLIDKKIHSTASNASDAKQSIDYRYNIRGWLTKMNDTDLSNDDPGDPTDYFSFELGYNNDIGIGNQSLYNGNISGMKWSSNLGLDTEKMKGYVYEYDPMNRIQDATFKEGTGNIGSLAWTTAAGNAFSEYGYTYDLNGNIKTLKRKGAGGSDMDILQYSYGGGFDQGNKLNYVTDSGIDTTGFRELNAPGYDYSYDTNGNLRWDKNKGGKDLLTNADFQAGASGWTVYDPGSRLSFPGPSLLASPGTDSATIAQQDIIQPNSRVLVFIELEHLSGSGSVNVNIGGTDLSVSVAGLNTIPVYAGGGTSVTITPSADFDGYIHNVQVKGYAVFEYNFLNLPERVTMGGDQYLMYYYDATGRKLTQELYKSDKTLLKRSDYIGEYFYENDTLRFINHEEGRVVMTGSEPEYQYHLKDHLGNVRLTFTTKDEVEETTATLETANLQEEQSNFLRYEHARRIQATLFDRTNGSSTGYSQRLNGTPNEKYGLAKSISVMPGDVVNTEVYAKYVDTESSNWTQALVDVMGAIAANTGGIVVDGGSYAASTSSFSYGGFVNTSGSSSTAPKAFLNWIVFDRDFNMLDGGFEQITTAAKETGTDVPHQRLFKDNISITKPGYVYIYLSNEGSASAPVEVFFDDFTVEHAKSPVVQMDDYYPYGLAFNSYSRENSTGQDFKFNGKEEQTELGLGWLDYGARMYQPGIGRWNTVDPLSDLMRAYSPFTYTFNNPIRFIDPDGMKPGDPFKSAKRAAKDFGRSYNDNAIKNNMEMGSTIYKFQKNGKTYYSYSPPAAGTGYGVTVSKEPEGTEAVATIHTHGAYDAKYDNNNFSTQDKEKADNENLDSYISTPNGALKMYDVETKKVKTLNRRMASDENDPDRLNRIDYRDGPKDERMQTYAEWLKEKFREDKLDIINTPKFDDHRKQLILSAGQAGAKREKKKDEPLF